MRKSLKEVTNDIRAHLMRDESISDVVDSIIPIEIIAVSCQLMDLDITLDEAWVLLTGFDEPVLPKHTDKGVLTRVRMLMYSFSGEANWTSLLDEYMAIPSYQQLVDIKDDYRYSFKTPRLDSNRKEKYKEILLNPIPYKQSDKKFAKAGMFTYSKIVDQVKTSFSGTIPKSWIKNRSLLPEYREKKERCFDLNFNWLHIAKEMDDVLNTGENEWQERLNSIRFRSINGKETSFPYKGLQHIVGGLASGKSSFRTIQTYWLVKHKQAKIGIIEGSVADVLEEVQRLRSLGIHAVPIIGKSNRQRHLNNYLQSKGTSSVTQLEDEQLKHLSGICTLKALAQDFEGDDHEYYPCENVISDGKTPKLCPLAKTCGVYKDWTELGEADVWVTTSAAVLATKIPAIIDPYKRTIYEAMYDLLDVVFVDEADQVQKQFEDTFLNEYPAFGSPSHLVERLDRHFFEQVQGNYQLIANGYMSEWQMNLHNLKENVINLLGQLQRSRGMRNRLKREVVYLNYLIHDIAKTIEKDEDHYMKIHEIMRSYLRHATFRSVMTSDYSLQELVRVTNKNERVNIIKLWIDQMDGVAPKDQESLNILYEKIELFVYLANIEAALKYIKYYYPIIQQYGNVDAIPMLSMTSDFRPLMKEAMTGVMFGYRYEHKDGEVVGDFKIIQYVAVGRQLLHDWPMIYEQADERKGPAVVLLSGTSYAPTSLHYHIEHEPKWFISSTRPQSRLYQRFLPLRNPIEDESIIQISGIRNDGKRNMNLEVMIKELERKINSELTYWQKEGKNRRVLIVVNSYNDVKIVGNALQKSERWQGRYRLLSQDHTKDEVWYPRSMIELFAQEDVDVLVAPMLAISRGYNIMNGKQALFGTAFFLIRPYPIPNDLSYFVQMLHGQMPMLFDKVKQNNKQYVEAMRLIRKESRGKFEAMYSKPGYWSLLSEEERKILSWYTFIPTWQLIGRMLRGGSNARVYYCDGKFLNENSKALSLIDYWIKIMNETDDEIFTSLYGPFLDSIQSIKSEGVYI